MIKPVPIKREVTKDVVETLSHALKLAKLGEITGIVGAFRLKNGNTRKIVNGVFIEDIPKAIGELETVKMWLFGELELYDVPDKEEELAEIQKEVLKENE